MKHLLVTNDFPPKIGGIQSLLWEWWRRLPPDSFAVLTSPHADAADFDAAQPYRIERTREPVLLPHPWMVQRINAMAKDFGADFVVLDPALPLGLVGPSLKLPYMVVLHGAEVTVLGVVSLGWVKANRLECDLAVVGPFIEPDVPGEVRRRPFATFLVNEFA